MTEQPKKNMFLQPGRVKIVKGSILYPENAGLRFVLNVNNMVGKAENAMYPVLDKKWPKVKQEAKGWFNTRDGKYKLGAVNTTAVQSDTWVIHCLVQDSDMKTDLGAVETALKEVCKMAKYERATIHISTLITDMIPELSDMVTKHLVEQGVAVSFYEEPDAQ